MMINNSYAVCIPEHLLVVFGSKELIAGSQFDTWYKTLENLKLSQVGGGKGEEKQQTPAICIVLYRAFPNLHN